MYSLANKYNIKEARTPNFLTNMITLSSGKIKFYNNVSILRWSGVKAADKRKFNNHFVNEIHKTRYLWFKYLFFKKIDLVKEILSNQKIFLGNFVIFKYYYFIFDISMNYIRRKTIRLIKRKNTVNSMQIYKKYRLSNIFDQSYLFKITQTLCTPRCITS